MHELQYRQPTFAIPPIFTGIEPCTRTGMISDVKLEEIVNRIIGCAIEVHRTLGPGLLEAVYRECLQIELHDNSLRTDRDVRIPLTYKSRPLRSGLRLDLLIEGCVIVEVKAIDQIHPVHLAQVITYLKLSDCPVGLLMNFNMMSLRAGLRRLDHPDRYKPRTF